MIYGGELSASHAALANDAMACHFARAAGLQLRAVHCDCRGAVALHLYSVGTYLCAAPIPASDWLSVCSITLWLEFDCNKVARKRTGRVQRS